MWSDGQRQDLGAFAFWIHQQEDPEVVEAALREITLSPRRQLEPEEARAYLEQLALNAGVLSRATLDHLLARPDPGWCVLSNPRLTPAQAEAAWGHILDRIGAIEADLEAVGMEPMAAGQGCDAGTTMDGLLTEAVTAIGLYVERCGPIPDPQLRRLLSLCVEGFRPVERHPDGTYSHTGGRPLGRAARLWLELVRDLDRVGEAEIEWLFRAAEDRSPALRAELLDHPASGPGMWAEALKGDLSERVRARAAERLIALGNDLGESALLRLALPHATAETLSFHLLMTDRPVGFRRAFLRLRELDPEGAASVLARRTGRAASELEPDDIRPLLSDTSDDARAGAARALGAVGGTPEEQRAAR